MPPFVMREVMSGNPLSINIAEQYGGRGGKVEEILALLSVASYKSLALSRIISMEMVINLSEKGFRTDLIDNSIYTLKKEISSLFIHFNFSGEARLVEDYL